MPRPRIYDEGHFRLSTYRNKAGKTYIYGYRNEWNKEKKQSRVVNRQYVGTLDPETGKAKLGPKFLAAHPEYAGKDLYYQDNELIEWDAVRLEEATELEECFFSDDLSVGATWSCWETAKQTGILSDLCKIFGNEDGSNLLRLGIYQYLTGKALFGFEDWIPDVYLPDSEELQEQDIENLLSRVDYAKIHAFFRIRSDRSKKTFEKLAEKESQNCLSGKPQFLAICAKGLPMFSNEYEGNNQESEYRQTDLILVVDFSTGDICYAFEYDGLINDRVPCQQVLKDMQRRGFDLTNTVFVKDQEVGFPRITNSDFQYVAGIPFADNEIVEQLKKHKASLQSIVFLNGKLGITAIAINETGLNLFCFPDKVAFESIQLLKKIEEIIEAKNGGKTIDPLDWQQVCPYIKEAKNGTWEKNFESLVEWQNIAGCFAISSDCIKDPIEAQFIYRLKDEAEKAYRRFTIQDVQVGSYGSDITYAGKLLVHLIAQNLRMNLLASAQKNQKQSLSSDSFDKAMAILGRVRAQRSPGRDVWITGKISQKAREVFELLGVAMPPKKFGN